MPSDRHFETAIQENTLIAYWVGQPTAPRLEAMLEELHNLWRRHHDGVYLVNVITQHTGIPDTETRKILPRQFESMRSKLKAAAIVLEKSGIDGAMSRTILATLVTVSGRPFAMRIFSSQAAAAEWISGLGGSNRQALCAAMSQLARRFDGSPNLVVPERG